MYSVSEPLFGLALLVLLLLASEFGFRAGRQRGPASSDAVRQQVGNIQAALRARLLPTPQRVEAAGLFRRYVEVRLEAARGANLPTPRRQVLDDEAGQIQERLWRAAVAAAEADPQSVPAGLFTQAMNELIDFKGERDAALANHVPESVLALIFAFAVLAIGVVGYENGYAGARTLGVTTLLCALTALVIVDLDRPRRGLIRVSQESMVSLQKNLEAPAR